MFVILHDFTNGVQSAERCEVGVGERQVDLDHPVIDGGLHSCAISSATARTRSRLRTVVATGLVSFPSTVIADRQRYELDKHEWLATDECFYWLCACPGVFPCMRFIILCSCWLMSVVSFVFWSGVRTCTISDAMRACCTASSVMV
jgi:hypothetical protein